MLIEVASKLTALPTQFFDDDTTRHRLWDRHLVHYLDTRPCIDLDDTDVKRAFGAATAIADGKVRLGEREYVIDGKNIDDRYFTGNLAEIAVEKYAGLHGRIMNPVVGSNRFFHRPDLDIDGIRVGVKSARAGLCPMVPISSKDSEKSTSQIICVVGLLAEFHESWPRPEEPFKEKVWIIGLATPEMMERYSHRWLIANKEARRSKAGFWGFEYCKVPPPWDGTPISHDWFKP